MDDIAALTHRLEYLFLKKTIYGLRDKTISVPKAKENAKAFLAIQPFTSPEDAYVKIMEFVAKHNMFIELKDCMNTYQMGKNDLAKIAEMRMYIKQGNIDTALTVAKTK